MKKTDINKTNGDLYIADGVGTEEISASTITDPPKKKKRLFRSKKEQNVLYAILFLDLCALICLIYFIFTMKYMNLFLPNTSINGIDISNLTTDEAEKKIADLYQDYKMEVKFRGGTSREIKARDIDYKYVSTGITEAVMEEQNPLALVKSYSYPEELERDLVSSYDEEKLNEYLNGWDELKKKKMKKPVNARLVYQDNKFAVAPEDYGTKLSKKKAVAAINEALKKDQPVLDMESVNGLYKDPTVFSDDEELNKEAKLLGEVLNGTGTVTYSLPTGKTLALDGTVYKDWLEKDKKGNYVLDKDAWEKHLDEYVKTLAEEYDTVDKEHEFKTHSGEVITVRASGYYGWKLNQAEELEQLRKDLKSGKNIEREPIYSRREVTTKDDNYGYGSKYCEIDLSKQHLWIYVDGEVVIETDVVSGTNDGRHLTPAGSYYVYGKMRNTTLRGPLMEDGEYEWESDVSYWMRLTDGGVGMHDANWRGSFGGDIWLWNGSHGCINLPPWITPEIYEVLEENTPVVVYYS